MMASPDLMPAPAPQAWFLDLDGTLIDTAQELTQSLNGCLSDLGLAAVSRPQVERWIGHGTRALVRVALDHAASLSQANPAAHPWTEKDLAAAHAAFVRHYHRICGSSSQLYPEVLETLQVLHGRGVRLAVVTNKDAHLSQILLRAHGLDGLIDVLVGGDTFPVRKPDPFALNHLRQQWSLQPSQCRMVGDSCVDATTARNAGIPVWLITGGYNFGNPPEVCQPDRVISRFGQLLEAPDRPAGP